MRPVFRLALPLASLWLAACVAQAPAPQPVLPKETTVKAAGPLLPQPDTPPVGLLPQPDTPPVAAAAPVAGAVAAQPPLAADGQRVATEPAVDVGAMAPAGTSLVAEPALAPQADAGPSKEPNPAPSASPSSTPSPTP